MIKVQSKIKIKSESEKIWSFLNNPSLVLSFNRFHKKIDIQDSFSINIDKKITIQHNFGFGLYDMELSVVDISPNNKIIFEERAIKEKDQLFNHKTTFEIKEKNNRICELNCTVEGSFKNKFADLSFKPILKGVILDELIKIKLAIESSDIDMNHRHYKPV
tara:strand:- start:85 stop:567 length:483 start_codon:yes stop_codon:yes gene_type:complete